MDLMEVVDRQKGIIQSLAAIVAEQAAVIEQHHLAGPGVEVLREKRRMVQEDMKKVDGGMKGSYPGLGW